MKESWTERVWIKRQSGGSDGWKAGEEECEAREREGDEGDSENLHIIRTREIG